MRYNSYILFLILLSLGIVSSSLFANDISSSSSSVNHFKDVDITGTSNVFLCFADRNNFNLNVDLFNSGTDTVRNIQFGWFLTNDQKGSSSWSGVLSPNNVETITLNGLGFSAAGTYTISIWINSNSDNTISSNDSITIIVTVAPPFVVKVLNDTAICSNSALPVSVPNGFTNYLWSNGANLNQTNVSDSGSYRVTITDVNGCESIDSFQLYLHQAPSTLLPGDTIVCDGTILTTVGLDGFSSYVWDSGDTTDGIIISQPGDYSVTVTDTMGCNYTDTMNVQYLALPNPSTSPTVTICPGDSTTLNVSSNFSTYSWSNGSTGTSIVINQPGTYYVTVTGSNGCIGIDTVQVTLNPAPIIEFYDSVMCNLEPIMMDVGWFTAFHWSDGSTIQNPIFNSPGVYSVTVTDGNGCQTVDSIEVVNFDVVIDLGVDTTFCVGGLEYLYLDNYDSYYWNNGETGSVHWIGDPGLYSVTVTNGACSATDDLFVTVLDNPIADFSEFVVSPDVEFTNMSNVSSVLSWDFGDNTSSGVENPIHTYANAGIYTVVLTARNMCDTSVLSKTISIFPQSDGSIYVNNSLRVFPTLTTSFLKFSIEEVNATEINYVVYNAVGKLLINKEETYYGADYEYQLDVSRFASGTYYIRISADGELKGVQSFVKQ